MTFVTTYIPQWTEVKFVHRTRQENVLQTYDPCQLKRATEEQAFCLFNEKTYTRLNFVL